MEDEIDKKWNRFLQQVRDFQNGTRTNYPDLLLEPLYLDPEKWGPEPDGGNVRTRLPREQREIQSKLQRLRQQYIDSWMQSQWGWLLITYGMNPDQSRSMTEMEKKLVERHVRGFRIIHAPPPKSKKGRGAPKMRDDVVFPAIVFGAVNEACRRIAERDKMTVGKVSVPAAIKEMDPRFRDLLKAASGKPLKASYLAKVYSQTKTRLAAARELTLAEGFEPLAELEPRYKNSKID